MKECRGNLPDNQGKELTTAPLVPKPLHGDSRRQATSLFKGIAYQIWQTVLAWSELGDNEILVVEGAEDFDVVGGEEAITNQVKALAAPISLRSECVCEALRNFWVARHNNPSMRIRLRFITTASFGIEEGQPMGDSRPGLEFWNEEAQRLSSRISENIRKFLLLDPSIRDRLAKPFGVKVPSLVSHINELSPDAFHSEFVRRIHWLAQQPDITGVRDIVRSKIIDYGTDKHLLARDCEPAMHRFFEYVTQEAIKQRRKLTRADFAMVFDDATRVFIPLARYHQFESLEAISMHLAQDGGAQVNFSPGEVTVVPDLPVPCAKRTALVNSLVACLNEHGFLAIQGSTGKGKSNLAKMVARKQGGKWYWTSFATWEASRISEELRRLAQKIAVSSEPFWLLLDNFNPGPGELVLLQQMVVLIRLNLTRGGRIILTTQRLLDVAFLRQSNLQPIVLQEVPSLEKEEVETLCVSAGCPVDERLQGWTNIIYGQTSGHPQLVHARVLVAQRRAWPMPTVNDVLEQPQELSVERQQSRQLLRHLQDGEIELLYRLSLASGLFRKDQAIAIAEIIPSIARAGDRFNGLVGPWIEPAGGSYFRLSSLLFSAAQENWTSEHVTWMRKAFGRAILRTGNLTLTEASEVLFQAVAAKDPRLAGTTLASLMMIPFSLRKECAQALSWTLLLPNPVTIFPEDPFVCCIFSQMQFWMAAASDSASAPRFAEQFIEASKKAVNSEVNPLQSFRSIVEVILAGGVLVSPPLLLECWREAVRLAEANKHCSHLARSIEDQLQKQHVFQRQRFPCLLFNFILSRHGSGAYLCEFIGALEGLTPLEREPIVAILNAYPVTLFGFIDNAWTHELSKEIPEWDNAINTLEKAYEAGKRWGAQGFAMVAARAIAAVQDEYLHQRERALETLAEAACDFGSDGVMLRYQRGMIHRLHREYAEAYDAWASTLDEWPTNSEHWALYALFAFSNCGASAGFLNRWDDAASAFGRGRELAINYGRKFDALKFGIDAAYSMWRANRKQEALAAMSQGLKELEELAGTINTPEFHTQWKLTEHVVIWCAGDAGMPMRHETIPPRPGICSEAKEKEKHELLKDHPRAPVVLSWHSLAQAEFHAELGCNIFLSMIARPDVKSYPGPHAMIELLRVQRALAKKAFEEVPLLAESAALAFGHLDTKDTDERTLFSKAPQSCQKAVCSSLSVALVEECLLCMLILISERQMDWEPVLEKWKEAASKMQSPATLLTGVDIIACIHAGTARECYAEYASPTATRFRRLTAAICMAVHPDAEPAMRYVGLCSLVTDDGLAIGIMKIHNEVGSLTRRIWLDCASRPFELRSPSLNVSAIRTACDSGKIGLSLAASILQVAGSAVPVKTEANTQRILEKLAGGAVA